MQVNFTINIDDRLVKGVKAFFKRKSVIIITSILFITTLSLLYADYEADERIIFTKGTVIKASEMNHNFSYLWSLNAGSTVPVGTIIAYAGTTLPGDGLWDWCDGRVYDSTGTNSDYDDLRKILNYSPNLPDLRGRVAAGSNSFGENGIEARLDSTWANSLGQSPPDEAYNITLTNDNIPPHKHTYHISSATSTDIAEDTLSGTAYHITNSPTETSDGTDAHFTNPPPLKDNPDSFSIVQPTLTVSFIIKVKSATTE